SRLHQRDLNLTFTVDDEVGDRERRKNVLAKIVGDLRSRGIQGARADALGGATFGRAAACAAWFALTGNSGSPEGDSSHGGSGKRAWSRIQRRRRRRRGYHARLDSRESLAVRRVEYRRDGYRLGRLRRRRLDEDSFDRRRARRRDGALRDKYLAK